MGDLLTAVSTRRLPKKPGPSSDLEDLQASGQAPATTPESTLSILSSQPSPSALYQTLSYLSKTSTVRQDQGFNILMPSPKAAQIIFVLVNEVLPTFWPVLYESTSVEEQKALKQLLRVLRCSSGLGALLSKLKTAIEEARVKGKDKDETLRLMLEVFVELLKGDRILLGLWKDVSQCETRAQRADLWWKEICSVLTSGRIVSLVAEADALLAELSTEITRRNWIADASDYSAWLGKNLWRMMSEPGQEEWNLRGQRATALPLIRCLSLGHTDSVIAEMFSGPLSGNPDHVVRLKGLLITLSSFERRMVLYSLIRILSRRSLDVKKSGLQGSAALISALSHDTGGIESLQDWLVGSSPEAVKFSSSVHRAVVLALSRDLEQIKAVIWKALDLFSDKLYIKHNPILHQEVLTQVILISLSQINKKDSSFLPTISKNSAYLSGISNHLASSSPKVRFLGIIIGLVVSEKIDSPDRRLKFTSDGFDQAEWNWYKSLIDLRDNPGTIDQLQIKQIVTPKANARPAKPVNGTVTGQIVTKKAQTSTSKIITIEEIHDSESEDDDLPVYAKPDSDPSDDDEDPTLVQRNKPSAPVYIKDLLAGLQDTEDYDKHTLALQTAPGLIRRKAQFGTEVQDHLNELAAQIIGLKDRWDLDDFNSLRLRAMLAVLLADPKSMGPYFALQFYTGDLSLSQRGAVLSVLGLGAREIGGVGADDTSLTGADTLKDAFPSKRLPSKLHDFYALDAAPTNKLTADLSRMLIQPLAAKAADKITGPNALKIRTFSSRIEVEKKRSKPMSNKLAKIVAEAFFFPLTGRWQIQTRDVGTNAPQASPMLLSQFIKTLALILHAAGPNAPSLPELTSEFWDLLLSLRVKADDQSVLESLLFAFLMLLQVNSENERALAIEHARELLETQEWVSSRMETIGGGEEEGERCRMLAAGVLVRCKEIVEKHQRLLLGDMVGYMT